MLNAPTGGWLDYIILMGNNPLEIAVEHWDAKHIWVRARGNDNWGSWVDIIAQS